MILMKKRFLLELIEIVAFALLIYSIIYIKGERLIVMLVMVFGLLSASGSIWFLDVIKGKLPKEFEKALINAILVGSIALLALILGMLIFYGGSNV